MTEFSTYHSELQNFAHCSSTQWGMQFLKFPTVVGSPRGRESRSGDFRVEAISIFQAFVLQVLME